MLNKETWSRGIEPLEIDRITRYLKSKGKNEKKKEHIFIFSEFQIFQKNREKLKKEIKNFSILKKKISKSVKKKIREKKILFSKSVNKKNSKIKKQIREKKKISKSVKKKNSKKKKISKSVSKFDFTERKKYFVKILEKNKKINLKNINRHLKKKIHDGEKKYEDFKIPLTTLKKNYKIFNKTSKKKYSGN